MTEGAETPDSDKIIPRVIEEEMKQSYLDYAMSVIVSRALPDVRDGLKPVHRRILFAMHEMGMVHNKPFKKSARVVGEVLGKYHPHGDTAVYDSLVRMAQEFSLRYMLVDGQGNFGCFTADTKVKLADGRDVPFIELVKEWKAGKKNYTFTVNSKGKIEIAQIINPRKTKSNAELLKVTLDNGEKIRCTLNHLFLLKDLSYKEAKDLKLGDSLMPCYSRKSTQKDDRNIIGYSMVYQPIEDEWVFEHHLADQFNVKSKIYDHSAGRIRHHKDFNKLNNNPDNILRMQWKDHWLLHAELTSQKHKEDSEYRNKLAQGREKFWANEENRNAYSKRMSQKNLENWQDKKYREKMKKFLSDVNKEYISIHPELRKEFSQRATQTFKRLWKDPKYKQLFHEKIVASNKKRVTNNTGKVKFLKTCKETLKKYSEINEESFEKTRNELYTYGRATSWKKGFKKYFDENQDYLLAEVNQNHKIASVEFLSQKEDVYDLTIEDTHNFALSSGVFVHNSVDGDNAAAMRYTEARLTKIAEEMLKAIDKNTVDFRPNFDGSLKEPSVLPSQIPNLLINGSSGIAVGMATNIPPHNLKEVCSGVIALIDNPNLTIEELMEYIKGPDFPTQASIAGTNGIKQAYLTGRGKVHVKAKAEIVPHKDRERIIVTELPYMVNKAVLLESMADLVKDKKVMGISDLRDESNREGIRVVIELKKDANANVVLNQLLKYTRLTTTFGVNMLALVDNQPKLLNLKQALYHYLKHRQVVVRRRTEFELKKAEERCHILEGLIIALNKIDEVVQKIKQSQDATVARNTLMADYELSEVQAKAILDMKLQKLSSLEQEHIRKEHAELLELIKKLKDILASESKILDIIKQEITEIMEKYGDERRTSIELVEEDDLIIEDLIKEEEVVVTISHKGYIKRLPTTTYKQQNRGGKGIKAAGTGEEDFIEHLFISSTHSYILFFTDQGNVHWLKVYAIPEASRQARGRAVVNLLQLGKDEKISAFIPVQQFDDQHNLIIATKKGTVKKTNLSAYARPRQGGIKAIVIREGDELVNAVLTDGNQQIMLASKKGNAIKFHEQDARPLGRVSGGVRGMSLREGDEVIAMAIADDEKAVFTITEKGMGKRTKVSEYSRIKRGGLGVRNILVTEKSGKVIAVRTVDEEDELMFISKKGIIIRTAAKGISCIGRNTQGVRVMRLSEGDTVVAAAKIVNENGEVEDKIEEKKEQPQEEEKEEKKEDLEESKESEKLEEPAHEDTEENGKE